MLFPTNFLVAAAGILAVAIILLWTLRKNSKILPPGPPRWPVFGNLLDMPKVDEWVTFKKWGEKYRTSPISQYNIANLRSRLGYSLLKRHGYLDPSTQLS